MIDQLISQIVAKVGVPEAAARQGVGVVLGLLQKQGDQGAVSEIFAKVPGAEALAQQYAPGAAKAAGGPMGGLLGKLGGMIGGKGGDTMSALAAFQQTGLSPEQGKAMVPVAKDFLAQHVGEDTTRRAIGSVPALKGFVS
jgi:hypothetical protein